VDHRRELLEALDRDGAPVRLQDIELLENEIRRAHQYMEQAVKLQEASRRCGEGLPEYDDRIPRDTVCYSVTVVMMMMKLISQFYLPLTRTIPAFTFPAEAGIISFYLILIQAARPIKHKQSNTHKTLKLQLQLQTG